ncbi:MAG TPA: phosphoribosyl-AMP cyclohydrolase [Methanocorpusculum sp.]|nr:phosphoribosyl-AMP cyclohydrolase [Methanocorpusculum sp.]
MTYTSAELLSHLKYSHHGLIPVVVQDAGNKDILMFAYANEEAVKLTVSTGFAHYFSRSRGKLWKKGEESGHLQKLVDIRVDCDADVLLYLVEQEGCACHEGFRSCFFRDLDGNIILKQMKDPKEIYR